MLLFIVISNDIKYIHQWVFTSTFQEHLKRFLISKRTHIGYDFNQFLNTSLKIYLH